MPKLPAHLGPYVEAPAFVAEWLELAAAAGARVALAGRSVEGRAIHRLDLGARAHGAPTVLLTALLHGTEVVGSLALREVVRRLAQADGDDAAIVGERARVVVIPIANPDAHAENLDRLARGSIAFRRGNARGVDLNRNFGVVTDVRPRHPFAGSSWPRSPYYAGPGPFSEPETRAIGELAEAVTPDVAIGFHSFGELLLHPWAWTDRPNPREPAYAALGRAFVAAQRGGRYVSKPAHGFYPTVGDLDDWLDATLGALAFTVEVGALDRRLLEVRRLVNPFCWMNPSSEDALRDAVDLAATGTLALLRAHVEASAQAARRGSAAAAE
jgi:predicted deacylase